MSDRDYTWRKNQRFSSDPKEVGGAVERIEQERGTCTPRELWMRAREENLNFSKEFEYDDTLAGPLYRDSQARRMMNSLVITVEKREEDGPEDAPAKVLSVPAFISVTNEVGDRGYRPVEKAMQVPNQRDQALDDCRRSLNALRRRYSHLKEFAEVWEVVDVVISQAA